MCHALILEENMIISRAIEDRLVSLGYDSFDHAWTEDQALEAAELRPPDLVVVGDSIVGGSPLDAAQRISNGWGAPILLITAGRCRIERQLPKGATLSRPFPLSEFEGAVALATMSGPGGTPRGSANEAEPLGIGENP